MKYKINKNLAKKNIKKFIIYGLTSLLLFIIIITSKMFFNDIITSFDNQIRDYMFIKRGEIKTKNSVIIINIDEKSLSELGQWPWSRDKIATIIKNLSLANIAVIGLDVVFAEIDNSSPAKIFNDYNITNIEVPDFDKQLNYMVKNTPTILGYQFELTHNIFTKNESLDIPAIIVEKNKELYEDFLIKAQGTILNHYELQNSAYSSGFFNNIPDNSGVIRSVPLVIKYDEQIYPSLALEIIRASMGIEAIFINYTDLGIDNIQMGEFKIPTDKYGRFMINYRGPSHTFKYYSAVDIYNNKFDKDVISGKVALLGATASGLNDLKAIPFNSVFPGVEVHANIIDNIITKDYIYIPQEIDSINLVLIFLIIVITLFIISFSPLWFNPFVLFITSFGVLYATYFILFEYGIILNSFILLLTIFLTVVMTMFLDYIFKIKQEQIIKEKFSSKVSQKVMEDIIAHDDMSLKATNKEVTIFFSNIRNFSYISESAKNATVVINFLNIYAEPISKSIVDHQGTIDKFMGDSIMAYWNAPLNIKNHATKAVDSALEQLYKIKQINKDIVSNKEFEDIIEMCALKNIKPLDIGIGINTGDAVIGEIGSILRSDYTVIGDSVNLGFKLESLCKYYGSKCNISNFTKWQLENKYIFRYLDLITIKGNTLPLQVWEVIDFDNASVDNNLYYTSRENLDDELSKYHIALNMYQDGLFQDAIDIFIELDKKDDKTNDKIYKIYIDRCKYFLLNPPTNFNGVFSFN